MGKKKRKPPKQRFDMNETAKVRQEIRRLANNEMGKIRREIGDEFAQVTVACFALALHDEFGFGHDRLMRGMKRYLNEFNAIVDMAEHGEGQTLEDIKTVLLEECRIDIDTIWKEEKNDLH